MNKQEKEWLVSDEYCKGCKYYGRLSATGTSYHCCDYTYATGLLRHNPPKTCEVKQIGQRPSGKVPILCGNHKRKGAKPNG